MLSADKLNRLRELIGGAPRKIALLCHTGLARLPRAARPHDLLHRTEPIPLLPGVDERYRADRRFQGGQRRRPRAFRRRGRHHLQHGLQPDRTARPPDRNRTGQHDGHPRADRPPPAPTAGRIRALLFGREGMLDFIHRLPAHHGAGRRGGDHPADGRIALRGHHDRHGQLRLQHPRCRPVPRGSRADRPRHQRAAHLQRRVQQFLGGTHAFAGLCAQRQDEAAVGARHRLRGADRGGDAHLPSVSLQPPGPEYFRYSDCGKDFKGTSGDV